MLLDHVANCNVNMEQLVVLRIHVVFWSKLLRHTAEYGTSLHKSDLKFVFKRDQTPFGECIFVSIYQQNMLSVFYLFVVFQGHFLLVWSHTQIDLSLFYCNFSLIIHTSNRGWMDCNDTSFIPFAIVSDITFEVFTNAQNWHYCQLCILIHLPFPSFCASHGVSKREIRCQWV